MKQRRFLGLAVYLHMRCRGPNRWNCIWRLETPFTLRRKHPHPRPRHSTPHIFIRMLRNVNLVSAHVTLSGDAGQAA